MRVSLRTKLIASFILVTALTLALSSFLFYRAWLEYAVRSKKAELTRQAEILTDTLTSSWSNPDSLQITNRIVRYSSVITGARVIILNATGQVVADTGRSAIQNGPAPQGQKIPEVQRRPNRLNQNIKRRLSLSDVAFASVPLKGGPGGRLLLVSQVRDIKRAQGPALNILLVTSIVSFFIASLAGSYLAFNLMKPLEKLKAAVRDMGRGQFLQNIPVNTNDEIGGLSKAFNLMSARVHKAYSLQQDFASNVSHELKTPLTSIEGFSKVLLDDQIKDKEQQKRYLEIINTESRRITKIVNGLLALARIDAGSFKPQVSEIDAATVLSSISEKFTPLTLDKNISLSIKPADVRFINDGAVVEQIIGNLVENAIKYTGEGGTINILAEQNGSNVCFRVKDSGIGISPEEMDKIFNRFYRADKSNKSAGVSGKSAGAGLGLSICQALVKSLGGTIEVASTPGTGTEFSVYLPKSSQVIPNKP